MFSTSEQRFRFDKVVYFIKRKISRIQYIIFKKIKLLYISDKIKHSGINKQRLKKIIIIYKNKYKTKNKKLNTIRRFKSISRTNK